MSDKMDSSAVSSCKLHVTVRVLYFSTDGLAWDWVNQKLYWADQYYKRIEVLDLSTNSRKLLFATGVNSNPRNIIVDPSTRWGLYLVCCPL